MSSVMLGEMKGTCIGSIYQNVTATNWPCQNDVCENECDKTINAHFSFTCLQIESNRSFRTQVTNNMQ